MNPYRIILILAIISHIGFQGFCQIGEVNKTLTLSNGSQPSGICWDGSNLWVIDYSQDLINKLNPSSGEVLLSFSSPDIYPTGLAWDGEHLWCSGNRKNEIFQLSPLGEVISSVEVSGSPRGITFVNGNIWYADSSEKTIYEIDTESGEVLNSIPAPGGASRGLSYDGRYLWCADKSLKEIYKIDIEHKKIILILPALLDYPHGLSWDGSGLWVAGHNSGILKRIETSGSEKVIYLDSVKANLEYKLNVRNVGATLMNLRTWICEPYSSVRQNIDSEISYSRFPLSYTSDQWGQRFAFFNALIDPGDSIVYSYNMDVTSYDLRYIIYPDEVGNTGDVPVQIQNAYLADGEYYDIHNEVITAAVNEAIGRETNMYWKARKIHDYLIDKIHYELIGGWDAAPQVLTQGHGSCSEYTYTFISMCRAANIPARYEAGAYHNGSLPYIDEVFHRWTQIYLPPYGWIHIDATWDDREYPANQSRYFGAVSKKVFANTLGGGGSNKISWTYNSANSQTGGIRERSKQFVWSEIGTSGFEIIPKVDHQQLTIFPNPVTDQANINFKLAEPSNVYVCILNLQGSKVSQVISTSFLPGDHILMWDSADLSPGAYILQLRTDTEVRFVHFIIM